MVTIENNANIEIFEDLNTELKQYNTCSLESKSNAKWNDSQESLMIWCKYALQIEAGACVLYSENFGNKILDILTRNISISEKEAELKKEIENRLLRNEYILHVDFLSFKMQEEKVYIVLEVETVYTKEKLEVTF